MGESFGEEAALGVGEDIGECGRMSLRTRTPASERKIHAEASLERACDAKHSEHTRSKRRREVVGWRAEEAAWWAEELGRSPCCGAAGANAPRAQVASRPGAAGEGRLF